MVAGAGDGMAEVGVAAAGVRGAAETGVDTGEVAGAATGDPVMPNLVSAVVATSLRWTISACWDWICSPMAREVSADGSE